MRRTSVAGNIQLTTAATQEPCGVSMQAIPNGLTGDVQRAGRATIESGASVAVNDRVGSDSVGRCVPVTAPGEFVIGTADTSAGVAGVIVEVELA